MIVWLNAEIWTSPAWEEECEEMAVALLVAVLLLLH